MTVVRTTSNPLADRYVATAGRVQLTGVQALARLPIDQHRRDLVAGIDVGTLISGYEGSPLAGYDLELGRIRQILDANDVHFVPGLNEEAAATAVQGSQLAPGLDGANRDGVLGIWYGKAPGLDRATDALRHGNLMGAHPQGGAVLLVGDDPGAKSSSVPCASDLALQDLMIPFLYPGDSAEVLEFGRHAIALSRASGLWTALKIVTAVADGSSTVDLAAEEPPTLLPRGGGKHVPTARLLQPALGPLERDQVTTRLRLAREYSRLNRLNRIVGRGSADRVGIVASGRAWRDVIAVLERFSHPEESLESTPLRLLRVGMPYPLDDQAVLEFAEGLDEIIVVEEKRSFLEAEIRNLLYGRTDTPVTGKHDRSGAELFPAYGELDADAIAPRLHRALRGHGIDCGPDPDRRPEVAAGRPLLPLAKRAPYFCSGCPHNVSTKPLGDSLVGAGIGCHAMVLLMDESQVGNVTGLSQMGGEGLQWIGMAPFVDREHFTQNLGDGTFAHSGSLAIRAAVAAGVDITYKLLFNSAVAMTGGQQAVGAQTVPRIAEMLLAEGVSRVLITTDDTGRYRRVRLPRGVHVWDRSRMEEAQRVLRATSGVTVLIHDQECATEKRRRRRRGKEASPSTRVFINERVCEGCGDCGRKSNCLSVQPVPTGYGRKTRIHQPSCNNDLSCLDGDCPAFMTVTVGDTRPASTIANRLPTLGHDDLPDPVPTAPPDEFGIRLAGIGGTGVVTVSQVLATAGLLSGFNARSLDQTGLAQKGGAVVSDVRFSRGAGTTNKLSAGDCDLYVGCDILVAADQQTLAVVTPERTVTVLSTTAVPTGAMVSDPAVSYPDTAAAAVEIEARSRQAHVFDARALTQALFGDDQYANILMIGIGYQSGALPLPSAAIEQAIELNSVAVETNLQAFRWGRRYVVDPATVADHTAGTRRSADAGRSDLDEIDDLDELLEHLEAELTSYQNRAYAERFSSQVARTRRHESAAVPGSIALTRAVARNLFKLMAYKDEYEVARLSIRPGLIEELEREFGAEVRASWRLHPPVLRALGMKRKITLGPWFRSVFHLLHRLRGLRGTPFDPFGRAHVRVIERSLIDDYVTTLGALHESLTPATLPAAVAIAELPDMIRGYEEIKLANVARFQERRAQLLAELGSMQEASTTRGALA